MSTSDSDSASSRALRFRVIKLDKIFFKEWLSDEFKSSQHPLPNDIRKARNNAIIIGFIEMLFSLTSIGFYARRRSRVILIMIILTVLATIYGFFSKLKLSYCGLLTHALYTISIIGGFYIYIIIDYFLSSDSTQSNDKNFMTDTVIMLITSIPLLGLFVMGLYSAYLLIKLDEEI